MAPGVRSPKKYFKDFTSNGNPLPVFGRIFPSLIDSATGYFTRIPSTAGFSFGRDNTPGTSCSIKSRFAKPATVRARASCVLNYYFKFSKSFYCFSDLIQASCSAKFPVHPICSAVISQTGPFVFIPPPTTPIPAGVALWKMATLPRFVINDTFRRIEKIEIISSIR